MLIDTHCHLHFDAFDPDRDTVIARAAEYGVTRIVNVGTDPATNQAALELASKHPGKLFHTVGLHPHHSHEVDETAVKTLEEFAEKNRPLAIGEIGLDYFKSQADHETQKKAFTRMLALARRLDLPVIVHSRDAFEDTFRILEEEGKGLRGVMHCFSYDRAAMERLFGIGFLVSFTCNLTFKNTGALLEVAAAAPLGKFMLETDAPYLAPQIYRGMRNEPACVVHLAHFLAEKRGIEQDAIAEATTKTAIEFFKLA